VEGFVSRAIVAKPKVRFENRSHRRSFWQQNTVHLGDAKPLVDVVHELGHQIESPSPDVLKQTLAFLKRRTQGKKLQTLPEDEGYEEGEVAVQDAFLRAYMGKVYPDDSATEIVTMGLELFLMEPARLAEEDPECFDFLFRLFRGPKGADNAKGAN